MGFSYSRIIQQGVCNAPATMAWALYKKFKYIVFKDLVIYIYNIIILSYTYDEHIVTLQKVFQ